MPHPRGVDERKTQIEVLSVMLNISGEAIGQWLAGTLPPEEADMLEVAISLLEMRLSRARARRNEPTQPLTAWQAA